MSALSDLAGSLAPLLCADRPRLYSVRFIGSKTDLLAFASDGHVLAVVTVLGDFSHVGDVTLPGVIAQRLGMRNWTVFPWSDPEEDKDLTAEAHLQPVKNGDLTLNQVTRVMPKSQAPFRSIAWFLGPAIVTLGEVVRRLGMRVKFGGTLDPKGAMRVDSFPVQRTEGGELMWVSLAIMPARGES